jgi:aldehyde dehydrogenase (NAD+)
MQFLKNLSINEINSGTSTGSIWIATSDLLDSYSPVDGKKIASIQLTSKEVYDAVVAKAEEAFAIWRLVPAPKRGEVVTANGR